MQSFRDVAYTEAQANEGLEVDEVRKRHWQCQTFNLIPPCT